MQLEQTLEMYQPVQMQRTQQRERVYNIVDLESLSASALYTGDSGSSGEGLTIRPLGSNSSLHIHEGEGGTAHIKTRKKVNGSQYQNLNSYDAAMMDLLLDKKKMPKIQK